MRKCNGFMLVHAPCKTKEETLEAWNAWRAGDLVARERIGATAVKLAVYSVGLVIKTIYPRFDQTDETRTDAVCDAVAYALRKWEPERGALSNCMYWAARKAVGDAMRRVGKRMLQRKQAIEMWFERTDSAESANEDEMYRDSALSRDGTIRSTDDFKSFTAGGRPLDAGLAADVQAAVQQLTGRERVIVERRMEGAILQEIARDLGVSKERVRQIESRAHRRLRETLKGYADDYSKRAVESQERGDEESHLHQEGVGEGAELHLCG